jgi:hypothetical protein
MNRLVLCVLIGMIAVAVAMPQWNNNNQNYPNQQYPNNQQYQPGQFPQFPNIPNVNDLCKQPGANCKTESRFAEESSYSDPKGTTKYTRVCDDKGCYDRKVYSGSSAVTTSYVLMASCLVFALAKIVLH